MTPADPEYGAALIKRRDNVCVVLLSNAHTKEGLEALVKLLRQMPK
jgi:hypothetical protein